MNHEQNDKEQAEHFVKTAIKTSEVFNDTGFDMNLKENGGKTFKRLKDFDKKASFIIDGLDAFDIAQVFMKKLKKTF